MIIPLLAAFHLSPTLQDRLATIERTIEEARVKEGVPGAALVIVKDGRVVLMKGFGVRSVKTNLPVDADTLFRIQSVTKTFTATAFMRAVDQGLISVDDRPGKYLPWLKFKDPELEEKVTFRDLMSHRSGLAANDYIWMPGVLKRKEAIEVAARAVPTAPIGKRFQYNNLTFSIVGDAVGAAYKKPWEKVVESELFVPLKMSRTYSTQPPMLKDRNHADPHNPNPETQRVEVMPFDDASPIGPACSICSSASDMAKWLTMALDGGKFGGGRLMSEQRWEEMMTLQFRLGEPGGWLLGWSRRDWRGHKLIFHNGGGYGWTAQMAFMPDEHIGFVLLSNLTQARLREVAAESVWTNLVDDKPLPAPQPGPPPTEEKPTPAPADLPQRMAEAAGHPSQPLRSMTLECDAEYPQQALTGKATISWVKPGKMSRTMTLGVGRRKLASLDLVVDGDKSYSRWSFLWKMPLGPQAQRTTLLFNDLPPFALEQVSEFEATVGKVGADTVYVRKTPLLTEQISPQTFHPLTRIWSDGSRQQFSDWRIQDGLAIPFLIRETWPGLGDVVLTVRRVRINASSASALDARTALIKPLSPIGRGAGEGRPSLHRQHRSLRFRLPWIGDCDSYKLISLDLQCPVSRPLLSTGELLFQSYNLV